MLRHISILLTVLGLVCQLASCGGNGTQLAVSGTPASPGGQQAQQPGVNLPLPSTLRLASYTEASLFNYGSAFDTATCPHNLAAANGTKAGFLPKWVPGEAAPQKGMAYACYVFAADSYDRDFTIRFNWAAQQAASDFYVGLADFATNRWDIYAGPAAGTLTLTDQQFNACVEPATGRMVVAVLLSGKVPWQLSDIRLGAPIVPTVTDVSPLTGDEGTQVTFTATATGSPITSISWDFGGAGLPNTSTNLAPQITLGVAGTYQGTVTATNGAGSSTPFNFTIVVSSTQQPPQIVGAGPTTGVTGTVVDFSASNVGGTATTWSWDFGGGASNSALEQPSVTLGAVGQYTVTVNASNAAGSSAPYVFTLDVTAAGSPPQVQDVYFLETGNLTGAPSQAVTPTADILGQVDTYDWQFPGGAASPASSNQATPAETLSATPGTYACSLMVGNADGTSTFNFDINVSGGGNPPSITDVNPISWVHDSSTPLVATNMGGAVTTWAWTVDPMAGTLDDPSAASPVLSTGPVPTPPVPCSVMATNADGSSTYNFSFSVTPF